ncbi:hypothetical protein CANCADRAFT_1357 [Tortispora caseinolytica NRRL Y-17796]|uniref:Methyltransferase type 11 domain-containing protein n=1 Tax=Tortispora caseinolytica NRRL Y-17796 TaxID=767744 RepID=A0A1E4TLY7_9ASCO|nr:hypothetical protein CANCADRAFT_1357 [Tortispora caseinolytica NRRL Y-17796]
MLQCCTKRRLNATIRNYSSLQIFDRKIKELHRDRAAGENARQAEYLRNEVAARIVERLEFVSRKFPNVLDFGSGPGSIESSLCSSDSTEHTEALLSRLGKITMLESSKALLYRDSDPDKFPLNTRLKIERQHADEEYAIAKYPDSSFDAVISNMSLHWINDLPGVLKNINRVLVPDGMFMASMIGGDSLFELRTSLQLAEMERYGTFSPRLSPLAEVRDIGQLMQQAGFSLNTVDVDEIVVSYPDVLSLMRDLPLMGESNAVHNRPQFMPRDLILAASALYPALHVGEDSNEEGIPATFRIIHIIGWKPSPDQQKPLERGSGQTNLKEILEEPSS